MGHGLVLVLKSVRRAAPAHPAAVRKTAAQFAHIRKDHALGPAPSVHHRTPPSFFPARIGDPGRGNPHRKCPAYQKFFFDEINIRPVWICPFRAYHEKAKFDLYPFDPKKLYMNFGFWDTVPAKKENGSLQPTRRSEGLRTGRQERALLRFLLYPRRVLEDL